MGTEMIGSADELSFNGEIEPLPVDVVATDNISKFSLYFNPKFPYLKVRNTYLGYDPVLSCAQVLNSFEVLEIFLGISLERMTYEPFIHSFLGFSDTIFSIVVYTFVVDDSATSIVLNGPAFGEDDFRVCIDIHIVDYMNVDKLTKDNGATRL